jgi:hypothetical protein
MLNPIAEGLWTVAGHFRTPLFIGSVRMTVLAGDDGLVLHSPVALTAADVEAIAAVGRVAAILAPNTMHYQSLNAAAGAFPAARVFVPEGLDKKTTLPPRAEPISRQHPPELPIGIEHYIFDRHAIHECVLFHRPSRTLVTADLLYNYQREHGTGEKTFFGLLGCYGSPKVAFYHRFALPDRSAVRELVDRVREWAPQRIVMGHGRIVEDTGAAEVFAHAWAPIARVRRGSSSPA